MRASNFCKIDCQACCKISFILRPFLLERRKLPLCELQLILWPEKTLQHVITKKRDDSQKNFQTNLSLVCFAYQWKFVLSLKCSAQSYRDSSENAEKKCRRQSFNFKREEAFNRTSYDNPEPKQLFFEKQIESKKVFLILAYKTRTQKPSVQDFLSYPIVNLKLEIVRPHITLKFSNFKSRVSLSRYRYNCMQYMRLREYMHHLRTETSFNLCMQFADSVQFVIHDIVRENVPAYLCLWPSYVKFYREEKNHVLRLPNQKNGALGHDESCCDFKMYELTFVLVKIFVEYVCCSFDKTFRLPFWQNLMQFDCAVCNIFLFIFRDKRLGSPKNEVFFFQLFRN